MKLSLPGPPEEASPKKRKRKERREPTTPSLSLENNLEAFMDKLSMWQLMASLEDKAKLATTASNKDDLDWMQLFFAECVNPQ